MKLSFPRALAVAAVIAVSAVPAFAQLTFNGYYRVGAIANVDSNSTETTGFSDRIRLNISYAASDDMFGFKARLQGNSSVGTMVSGIRNLFLPTVVDTATTAEVGATTAYTTTVKTAVTAPNPIKFAQGYAKFLDGAVKVTAGILDITDYSVAQSVANPYFGDVYTDDTAPGTPLLDGQSGNTQGVIVQVWPIEGLSVAGVMRVDGTAMNLHDFGLDAYYMIPGVGKVLVTSQLGTYSATTLSASDDISKSYVSGGFSYTGYPGLVASAVLRYNNSTIVNRYTKAAGNNGFGAVAIVEYTSGPLFADVAADSDFTNSNTYIEGEVSYLIIPGVKARAYGAYNSTGSFASSTNLGSGYIRTELGPASGIINNNQYLFGADAVLLAGSKGELDIGINYGDKSNVSFPILVKANF